MNSCRISRWLTSLVCMACITTTVAQTKIVFSPHWTAQAQFTGYYVALAQGFYKDAGLDVTIKHPAASKPVISYLDNKESQLITLSLSMAMIMIDKGHKIVNVMQTSQQNGTVIVSRHPITSVESLRGMTIGHWKNGFSDLPMLLDKKYDLNIKWVPFISNINLYVSGAIDATLAMSYNELFQLKLAGQRIHQNQLLYMSDVEGLNLPEDGLYVSADYYQKHKDTVDKFVEASRKGWEWAVENPEEALDIVMLTMRSNAMAYNPLAQEWMLKETLRLLINKQTGTRTYTVDPEELKDVNKLLLENGFISKEITYKRLTQL